MHPVQVVYNKETMEYKTIQTDAGIRYLSEADYKFYEKASRTNPNILVNTIEETDFLYMNFEKQPLTAEDAVKAFEKYMYPKKDEDMELPEDVILMREADRERVEHVPNFGTPDEKKDKNIEWDLSGTIVDCLCRYADQLSAEECEEIISGLEAGLSEKQVKQYFALQDAERMRLFKRALLVG